MKQARHVVRVDTWLCENVELRSTIFVVIDRVHFSHNVNQPRFVIHMLLFGKILNSMFSFI